MSKVLERAVHHQLHSFLSEHKLLNPFQCGFRRNHSTEFAAIAFSDYIRRGMDLGLLTRAVFIDLRKAFDSVDHEILTRNTCIAKPREARGWGGEPIRGGRTGEKEVNHVTGEGGSNIGS